MKQFSQNKGKACMEGKFKYVTLSRQNHVKFYLDIF